MRVLFHLDFKNYPEGGTEFRRQAARAIIIRDGRVALVHSMKYNYYKFPGGGVGAGESIVDALVREVAEETGLIVIPESVYEYGVIFRKEKGEVADIYTDESHYFFCETEEDTVPTALDDYEREEGFRLEWVVPDTAIDVNLFCNHGEKENNAGLHMLNRETRVLMLLRAEGEIEKRS